MHAAAFALVAVVVVALALRRAPSWDIGILSALAGLAVLVGVGYGWFMALWVVVGFMPTVSVPRALHLDMVLGVLLYIALPAAAAITTVVLIGRPPR